MWFLLIGAGVLGYAVYSKMKKEKTEAIKKKLMFWKDDE